MCVTLELKWLETSAVATSDTLHASAARLKLSEESCTQVTKWNMPTSWVQASWPHPSYPLSKRMCSLLDVTRNPGVLFSAVISSWCPGNVNLKCLSILFSLLWGRGYSLSVDSSEILESGNWCSCWSAEMTVQSWPFHCTGRYLWKQILRLTANHWEYCLCKGYSGWLCYQGL